MKGLLVFCLTIVQAACFAPPTSPLNKLFQASTNENDLSKKIVGVALPNKCPRAGSTAIFGIPKMFRWLTDQYPNINSRLNEGLGTDKVVDNFYLDMNGTVLSFFSFFV